jgi:hypothetical protein
MRLNPNKPLRDAFIAALAPIGIPVKAKKIPKNAAAQQYILITSQVKKRFAVSKDCYDYLCQTVFDICYYSLNGYADADKNDAVEEQLIQIIEDGIEVSGFIVKEINFIESIPLDIETPTYSIQRQVITYQHWLGQTAVQSIGFPYNFPFTLS